MLISECDMLTALKYMTLTRNCQYGDITSELFLPFYSI